MGRNKDVRCSICSKSMRKDHLKRHQSVHPDILSMSDKDMREEIRAREATRLYREERRQKIEEIAHQEGIIPNVSEEYEVENASSLKEELLQTNKDYLGRL